MKLSATNFGMHC